MCLINDAETSEFDSAAMRCARKQHRCEECRRGIDAGETYEDRRAKWDGAFHTIHTCSHCRVAREWLAKECGGYVYGGVLEDLREHLSEHDPAPRALYYYVAAMRRKWRRSDGRLRRIPRMVQ